MTTNEWLMRGKETSPDETVKRIKDILSNNGFDFEYDETKSGIGECYSSRLSLVPPGDKLMGTNGKGMSKSLCAASAFGEMMERMSNAAISGLNSHDPMKKEICKDQGKFYSIYSEEQPDCIRNLKKRIIESMPDMDLESKKLLLDMTLHRVCGNREKIPAYPFYSVSKKNVEYLPLDMLRLFTGSNGMAAGNTIPEAIVEGASEIFERYVQRKVLEGGVRLTRLPDDVLSKYPHIVSIINEIENDGDKTVILMDASIGKHLPVMCGVCVSHNTGRVGVKFGAHPNMSVAIERIFTEGTQGRSIESFSNLNPITFQSDYAGKRVEHWDTLKNGIGRMPAELLMPYDSEHYEPWIDYSDESNQVVMWKMIDLMESLGADVYIRDTSAFGFPAVYIYATEISEAQETDWMTLSIMDAVIRRQYITTHLDKADDKDIKSLSMISSIRPVVLDNDEYSYLLGVPMKCRMPGGAYQSIFMMGMCEYYLGNISKANEIIKNVISFMGESKNNALEKAISTYLSGLASEFDTDDIKTVVSSLFPDCCDRAFDIMSQPKDVFKKLYPLCNGFDCENCKHQSICKYPETRKVSEKIWKVFNNYKPTDEEICETFKR